MTTGTWPAALLQRITPAWRRVLAAHRRYTSANGDALAGALTYALLVGSAPVVLLCSAAIGELGVSRSVAGAILLRDARVLLPGAVIHAVDGPGAGAVRWRLSLLGLLAWFSLRLVRALRTGVRAMCGQHAGSGNPLRDWLIDGLLGLVLMVVATSVVVVAAAGSGSLWSPVVSVSAVWLLFAVIMRQASWPAPGRPSWPAALRAAGVAAVLCALLTHAAHGYFSATSVLHAQIYQAAGALIGVLVWCSLTCRVVLRATAWASTAPTRNAAAGSGTAAHREAAADSEPADRALALWVVVPAYNEVATIGGVLDALAAQTDTDFALVVVDNGSTDGTAEVARGFGTRASFPVEVISEPMRGPGPAADAGFRHAISRGAALLARTDADCVPAPDWVAAIKSVLGDGTGRDGARERGWARLRGWATRRAGAAEMACGRSVPRLDEGPTLAERRLLPAVARLAGLAGRYRPAHRGRRYLTPYVLCHGHNIALTTNLYLRCGGTPRVRQDDLAEDLALVNRAREHSDRVVRAEHMIVQHSLRRLRAWGSWHTLLWYWDRKYLPADASAWNVR